MHTTTVQRHTTPEGFVEIAAITVGGRTFAACGAAVGEAKACGYLGEPDRLIPEMRSGSRILKQVVPVGARGDLLGSDGERLGTYEVTHRWQTPRSWVSSVAYQVRCTIDGRLYTGRSGGPGLIWNGRRVAS